METSKTITFPGEFDCLSAVSDFASEAAEAAGLDEDAVYQVQLAVDEACSNIIQHAYGGEGRGDIECTCHIEPEKLTMVLRDRGHSFDPSCVPAPDLGANLDDRETGGLGLYLIQELMDEVRFESAEGENVLTLVKHKE